MTEVAADKVLLSRMGHILIVTINRPEVRNAVDMDVCVAIGDAVEAAEADPDVRCIVLTGAGDQAFCAGADLRAIARGEAIIPPGRESWSFAGFVNHFTCKPTIAAVNGNALGGGTELALACDLVVSVNTATFGLPEVKRGLMAAAGGAFRLSRQLPSKIAMELLLTGRPMTARTAADWGLVNELVAPGEALSAALGLAEEIAANAPLAVQGSKRIAYGAVGSEWQGEHAFWELNESVGAAVFASEDAKEGPMAFAEKRSPVWSAR